MYSQMEFASNPNQGPKGVYNFQNPYDNKYYQNHNLQRGAAKYSTLPARRSQHAVIDSYPERSVTPDITRGLENNQYISEAFGTGDIYKHSGGNQEYSSKQYPPQGVKHQYIKFNNQILTQNLGIPVQMPTISNIAVPSHYPQGNSYSTPSKQSERRFSPISTFKQSDILSDSLKISPIDPRNTGNFHSSTPAKSQDLKAAANLENRLLSPKKSTMSNEELYAIIHKSKKKMNIQTEDIDRGSPSFTNNGLTQGISDTSLNKLTPMKSPETGYLGEKSRSRLSWSPSNGEYIDFNTNIDRSPPTTDTRSRQSWACNDRKGVPQTSRLDFKKLLLQHGKPNLAAPSTKKVSAVEQLKISKQQLETQKQQPDMSILELSGSPRTLGNRKLANAPGSPRNIADKSRPVPKLLSPRSQWRFANPRSDVLSSPILEDCREDESPSNSLEKENNSPKAKSTNINSLDRTSTQTSCRKQIFTDSNVRKDNTDSCDKGKNSMSVAQRIQAQRAQFFNSTTPQNTNKYNTTGRIRENDKKKCSSPPTLETAF